MFEVKTLRILVAFLLTQAPAQAQIINGEPCEPYQFPASLEIFVDALVDMGPFGLKHIDRSLCGGTLIKSDVLLTAAHCLDEFELTKGFGKILKLKYWINQTVPVDSWVSHENYKPLTEVQLGVGQSNDLALMFLENEMGVEPALLSSRPLSRDLVYIVGFSPNKTCAETYVNEIGPYEFQVGEKSGPRKCFGDSGGATYKRLKNGKFMVIGVTSHAYDTHGCDTPSVDTRVDAYFSWIQAKLAEHDKMSHGL